MIGKIKFFNHERKYGFILSEDSRDDFFFHLSSITGNSVKCEVGEEVEFEPIESSRKPGSFEASNVRHPSGYKEAVFSPTGHPSTFLFQWAYIQLDDLVNQKDGSLKKGVLHELVDLALDEDWVYGDDKNPKRPFPILRNYIINTFYKLFRDKRVVEITHKGESWASFNTGLVNELYEPIYALFDKNPRPSTPWKFHSFCCANIGRNGTILVRNFSPLPLAAKYFKIATEVIFDPDIPIIPRYDHIVYDSIERGRYPIEFLHSQKPPDFDWKDPEGMTPHDKQLFFRSYRKAIEMSPRTDRDIRNRIDDAIELAVKRARWNFKTAIPLFYPRKNNISLLLPIALVNDDVVDLALVVSRTEAGGYSGETVYKLKWAYDHARLVCRPDSDWLTPQGDEEEDDIPNDEELKDDSNETADDNYDSSGNKQRKHAPNQKENNTKDLRIQCPSCYKRYTISAKKVGDSPRKIRCPNCENIFIVSPN